jgi:hypothetical protein
MGIKLVGDYLIRWLFNLIEVLIEIVLLVCYTIVTNKTKEWSDMAAGTAVISLKK